MPLFSRKPAAPTSPITPALIARIRKFTDQNAHTDAVMALAKALGPGSAKELKVLEAIDVLHAWQGHITKEMQTSRNIILTTLLSRAMRVTDDATHGKLASAF
jgi:hypothetical protein